MVILITQWIRWVMKINVASKQYSLDTESYEIYVSGCNPPHCHNCHNPELWDFGHGKIIDDDFYSELKADIIEKDLMIEHIFIIGGEPLHQDKDDLIKLLSFLKQFNKTIWVFTGELLKSVDKDILDLIDYIKCGKYVESKKNNKETYGITLASSNQRLYRKVNKEWVR